MRVGRYSPFVEQGERTASLKEETPPDEVTLEAALKLLDQAQLGDEPLGMDPETNKPVYLKTGRFGPYVQRGNPDDEEDKPQNASLLKGMNPAEIDLATALEVAHASPQFGRSSAAERAGDGVQRAVWAVREVWRRDSLASCGYFAARCDAGTSGSSARSAKQRGRGQAAKREPLKVFEASPITRRESAIAGWPVWSLCDRWHDERIPS